MEMKLQYMYVRLVSIFNINISTLAHYHMSLYKRIFSPNYYSHFIDNIIL